MKLEDIINLANQNNGYLTPELVKNNQIYSSYIHRLVIAEELYKVERGIYITRQGIEDEYYINNLKYTNIVYSGDTAIFLNGLSNKQSPEKEVSIAYGMNIPKLEGYTIKQSRKNTFYLGITMIETPFGNKVRCYDKERCICDLFIRPDNYDYEDRVYAINAYKNDYLNFDKLYEYAKKLGVLDKVKSVFEVVAWN